MKELITVENLNKIYHRGSEDVYAVRNMNLGVKQGEIVAIIGPSGSGKTTLINIIGCLDNPSSGTIRIDGQEIFSDGRALSEKELTYVRRCYFGYVFQKFFLLPTLTVRENILLPSVFNPDFRPTEKEVDELLELLGLQHRGNHLPSELSGGEMQRTAIARALIGNPPILIADEPTGNLDSKRTDEIKKLLQMLNKKRGITIILVTHNPELTEIADTVLEINDGCLNIS